MAKNAMWWPIASSIVIIWVEIQIVIVQSCSICYFQDPLIIRSLTLPPMKALHKFFTITLVASLSIGLMACSSSTDTETTPTEVVKVELNETVKSSVAEILDGYFAIKDAMV